MTRNKLKLAKQFAIRAHDSIGHKRKYTDEPYHVHPARVADIVAQVTDDYETIIAAWLHDILEDVAPINPNFDASTIQRLFGDKVLQLVLEVTDISRPEDGNRSKRKDIDREHLASASAAGQTIKLADLIDNITDIEKYDKHFITVFKKEAILILPLLKQGSSILFDRLTKLLSNSRL